MYVCSNCGYETSDKKDFQNHLESCYGRFVDWCKRRVSWVS